MRLVNYRVDRITNIRMLDEKRKPLKELKEGGLDLPKHMAEHIYVFAGESIKVKFKAKSYIIDQVIDWFGKDINIEKINEEECTVSVNVNKEAFICWAIQYGLHIEVIEPAEIRERIADAVKTMAQKYMN